MAFSDDFTGSDGQRLETRTGWTLAQDGGYYGEISGNALAYVAPSPVADSIYTVPDQGSADQYTQATLTGSLSANFNIFYCINLVDDANYVGWRLYGTGGSGLRLTKVVAGTRTDLVTFQGVAGSTYKVERDGSTVRIYEDDIQQGSDQTVTDHQTETTQGIAFNSDEPAQITDFEAGALGGGPGTDNLLADDISSNSEVSSPAIGQTHAITANDISSLSTVSSPNVGQVHGLAADDISSASTVSQPSLSTGGTDSLLAGDISSSSELSLPSIGQTHVLSANGLESATELSNPNIGQIHVILADDIQSAAELSRPSDNTTWDYISPVVTSWSSQPGVATSWTPQITVDTTWTIQ